MPQQKPTYQELESRLAEAERTIAALNGGQAKTIVAREQALALRLQVVEDLHRQSEAVFQAIWELSSEAMALSDPDGIVLAANPAYAKLYGYALAEVVGHNFAIIFPEELRAWANEQYRITFASPAVAPAFEAEIRRANGECRMVESRVGFVTSDGQRIAMLSSIRDITERKRTEQALRESEVRYRRIVESTHEGVWILDLSGVTTYVNTRMATMLGYTPAEMIGRNAFDFVWPEDIPAGQEDWQRRRMDPEGRQEEFRYRHKNGQPIWCLVNSSAILDSAGQTTSILGMFADITERKEAEQALRQLNETLEARVSQRTAEVQKQADRLRALTLQLSQTEQRERQRLALVLHEYIQQYIVSAKMQVEWMGQGDRLEQAQPEQIRRTVLKVAQILEETLEATHSLTIDLFPPALEICGLTGGLEWLAGAMQEKNNFVVNLDLDDGAEPATEELKFLLFECVRELLSNSMRHAGVDQAEVKLIRTDGNLIEVSVHDQGRGFDPAALTDWPAGKLAFGLFHIQQRLLNIGGRLDITSAPGTGTKIILTAPAS